MIYCELVVRVGNRELDAIFTEMCSLYKYMSHNRAIMVAQTYSELASCHVHGEPISPVDSTES